ncbi:MAG: GntR family transcriptional regulator [Clostridia bacterium]|nr:GntR family transcriptional regulator [Clostridia bacterium]
MSWKFDKHTPVYVQIADKICAKIITGEYAPDEQIPSVRQLAYTAAVNPNTVQRALTELENEGILYSKGTLGRFVTSDQRLIAEAKHRAAKQLIADFLNEARQLSITKHELIKMIEEEIE